MRKNLPVTNEEIFVRGDELIVSKTDTKGKITFVNDTFLKISGFDHSELIGASHNIVRHPDMPVEAFADFWQTLQSGEPWTGAVKNRCKNGNFYWVLATASPLKEGGRTVGYMSVRRPLPQAIRDAATSGYKLFADGRAAGLAIERGAIVKTSRWARYKRASLRLKNRFHKYTALGGALFFAAGVLGAFPGFGTSITGGIVAVTGIVATVFGMRSLSCDIFAQLDEIKTIVQQIAEGDVAGDIDLSRDNEFTAVLQYLKALQTRLAYDVEERRILRETNRREMLAFANDFDASVRSVVDMVASASTELQSTAQDMSSAAETAQRQSTAVAAASEQASTNVQTVASAAEELSSSISEISRQVAESTRITSQAVTETEHTNAQIQGLAEAAQRIGDVVKLINDIAGQTNLLALNATIEAARAGEAGKGFAVVASEVKSLAGQTAKATEEISAKIAEMQSATSHSVEAVQDVGQTIARINEIATTIASAVEEQGAATQEIARNVQQASAGTAEVSSNIVVVTKAANDTGAASSQVLGAAGELSKQSETLRSQIDSFLGKIRAA